MLDTLDTLDADLTASRGAQDLYLDVFMDDRPTGFLAQMKLRDGRLAATPAELSAIGLIVDPDLPLAADGTLALDSLPGLRYRYEAAAQRLVLFAPPALRPGQLLGYLPPGPVKATRRRGLLLNYDVYASKQTGDYSVAVGTSLRWFGRAGALELSGVSRIDQEGSNLYERLQTRWSYSDPEHLWTWAAGDVITGSLSWSRAARLGGVQWRRNFSVRPDLIIIPIPQFSGQATLPSTVDLLVNNVQQFGADIQDGPFVLNSFPRISGAGEATLVVRDSLGRTTQTTVPIYVDAQRLAPGLVDFSLEVGKVRRSFGAGHDRYGELVASGSWQRGMTDSLTLQAHAEAGAGLRLAGVGLVWSPAHRWGLVTLSLAQSRLADLQGQQLSLGYQWNSPHFGLDLRTERVDPNFRDIGSLDKPVTSVAGNQQHRASFWMPLQRGSLAFTWLALRNGDDGREHVTTVSWTQALGQRLALTANAFDSDSSGTGVGISLNFQMGPTMDSGLSLDRADQRLRSEAWIRGQTRDDIGWGWDASAGESDGAFVRASANARGRLGDAWFAASHRAGDTRFFAQATGSAAWIGGHAFASRRINDAFAVVTSNGIPGVPVLYENRHYGQTDARGLLLLPDLHGWQRNRISIDPDGMGGNFRFPDLEQIATPTDGGAILASFAIVALNPALVVLLDSDGTAVAAGTRGEILGSGETFLVGFDGEVYLENAVAGAVLALKVNDQLRHFRLPTHIARSAAAQTHLGPLYPEVGSP